MSGSAAALARASAGCFDASCMIFDICCIAIGFMPGARAPEPEPEPPPIDMLIMLLLEESRLLELCGGAIEFMPSGYFSIIDCTARLSFTNFSAFEEYHCFSIGSNWKRRNSYIELNCTPPSALDMAIAIGCAPPDESLACCLVWSSTAWIASRAVSLPTFLHCDMISDEKSPPPKLSRPRCVGG